MLRSMYAGISGLKNFQTKLDVIGNNIANVSTAGFKKGRVTFQDMMSQTTRGAQAPTATRGGVNPAQVGLGSQLGSIDNIHTQGFRQTTNFPLDFALEGDGMFVVRSGDYTAYTRAGNFMLDTDGSIVNPQGYYLMGFEVDERPGTRVKTDDISVVFDTNGVVTEVTKDGESIDLTDTSIITITNGNPTNGTITIDLNGNRTVISYTNGKVDAVTDGTDPIDYSDSSIYIPNVTNNTGRIVIPDTAQSFSVQSNGIVNYIDENGVPRIAGQIALANFSNAAGLQKAGSNLFLDSPNAGYNGLRAPESEGTASIISGSLEMSNVDLAEEFTEMITAQRGFQANTRIITTSDEILQELVNLKR